MRRQSFDGRGRNPHADVRRSEHEFEIWRTREDHSYVDPLSPDDAVKYFSQPKVWESRAAEAIQIAKDIERIRSTWPDYPELMKLASSSRLRQSAAAFMRRTEALRAGRKRAVSELGDPPSITPWPNDFSAFLGIWFNVLGVPALAFTTLLVVPWFSKSLLAGYSVLAGFVSAISVAVMFWWTAFRKQRFREQRSHRESEALNDWRQRVYEITENFRDCPKDKYRKFSTRPALSFPEVRNALLVELDEYRAETGSTSIEPYWPEHHMLKVFVAQIAGGKSDGTY